MNDKSKFLKRREKIGGLNTIMRFPLIGSPGTLPKESDFLKRRKNLRGLKKGGAVKK